MKISVCIITKNEEEYIEKCIGSVYDIAYEIIILDTGSTDKTKEIVKKFDKVKFFETTWKNDFSIARNECISYASGDWILSIDGDEILYKESLSFISELVNQKSDYNIYQALIVSQSNNSELKDCFFRDFLFLNDKNIFYTKKIHEHLDGKILRKIEKNIKVENHLKEDFKIKYLNYANILIECLSQENNKLNFCHYLKHLSYLYEKIGNYEKALESSCDLLEIYNEINFNRKSNDYYVVVIKIIKFEYNRKNYNKCLEYCEYILSLFPNDSNILFYKANCFNEKGNKKQSIEFYKKSLEFIDFEHPNSIFFSNQIKNKLNNLKEVLV
jgi:glycosyltransferase involved in cell wall biosynthesis